MIAITEKRITILTSPKELRNMAGRLEEKCKTVKVGDSLKFDVCIAADHTVIVFSGDQDECRKEGLL